MRRLVLAAMLVALIQARASTMFAEDAAPSAHALLQQVRDGAGNWRTIQYVYESTDSKTTVAVEKPAKIRVEIRKTRGADIGKTLTLISNGENTWIYNSPDRRFRASSTQAIGNGQTRSLYDSDYRQYSRLSGALKPGSVQLTLNALLSGDANLFADLATGLDRLFDDTPGDPKMWRSDTVKVGREKRDSWVVADNSRRFPVLTYIDKILLIPLRVGQTKSLRIDESIPASAFVFAPPKGYREVSTPLDNPDPTTLLRQVRDGAGNWRTIQFVKELDNIRTSISDLGIGLGALSEPYSYSWGQKVTATVAMERTGRMRVEMKLSRGKRLTVVSDGASTWIANSETKQYTKLSEAPSPDALIDLFMTMLARTSDSVNPEKASWLPNLDLLPVAPVSSLTPVTLRAETIEMGGEVYDCWVITSPSGLNRRDRKTTWIDKNLMIPLRSRWGMGVHEVTKSLKVNEPISASTFVFTPPLGYSEVPR